MPPQPRTDARKRPRQARARATVDTILLATARVLAEDGFERATTNRIAKVAGVSVGSLYQYFPNKEALVAELVERHQAELLADLGVALAAVRDRPFDEAIRVLVEGLIAAHADPVDLAVHRVMFHELPRIGLPDIVTRMRTAARTAVLRYLEPRREALRPDNLNLAAFVLVHAVEAVLFAAVVEGPEVMAQEAFVEEVVALVLGYLGHRPPAPAPDAGPGPTASV